MGFLDGLLKPNFDKLKEKKDVKGLIRVLNAKDPTDQMVAAYTLGELAVSVFGENEIKALEIAEARLYGVNATAVRALDILIELRNIPHLIDAITPLSQLILSPDARVRAAAAYALSRITFAISEPTLIPSVTSLLINAGASDSDDDVVVAIEDGLNWIAHAAAYGLQIEDNNLRAELSDTLYVLGGTSVKALVCSLTNLKARANAALTLAKIGEPAIESLLIALNTAGGAYAAAALQRIGASALPGLLEALKHTNPNVRLMVADVLKDMALTDAIPALETAAACETDPEVKQTMLTTIATLNSP